MAAYHNRGSDPTHRAPTRTRHSSPWLKPGAFWLDSVKELTETGYDVRIMSRRGRFIVPTADLSASGKPNPVPTADSSGPANPIVPIAVAPRFIVGERSGARFNTSAATEWAQADLETGQGIADALAGIDVIVHAASSPFKHTQQIDVEGTRLLLEQARVAGVAHVIYISIVGIDRIPYAYYRAKLAAEELVKNGGIPWSILRATQFHYLVDLFFQAATKVPLVTLLPTDLQCQSIAESEVASRLCEIVVAGPSGRLPDLGGPEVLTTGEMVRTWLMLRGMHRRVLPLHLPGKVAQGFRRGYNTCPDQPLRGHITWTEWLQM